MYLDAKSPDMGAAQVLLQGGYRDGALTSAATVLSTEQWKWFQPKLRAAGPVPAPRCGHALCAVRSRLFLFGGVTEAGLARDLWILDLDALAWSEIPTFGAAPCARKGASLVATEDGRKLYLVGGATAAAALCDVHVLELDSFGWSALGTVGDAPAGRECPAVSLTPPYLLVAGGHAVVEGGARVAVSDFWVLHVQQCAAAEPRAATAVSSCLRDSSPSGLVPGYLCQSATVAAHAGAHTCGVLCRLGPTLGPTLGPMNLVCC